MSQNPTNSPSRDDLVAEGRALFDKHVLPERDRRSKALDGVLFLLEDALEKDVSDPEGEIQVLLSEAYPVDADRDKALGFWTTDDLRNASIERRANFDTDDAKWFHKRTERFIKEMDRRSAKTLRGLFECKSADEEYAERMKGVRNVERIAAEMIAGGFATFGEWAEAKYGPKPTDSTPLQYARDNDAILDAAEYREDL